jgi:hypothetical protein
MKDRIIAYLAQGFKPIRVSEIVGCATSYVSQVQASPDYEELLAEEQKKFKKSKEEQEQEEKLNASYVRLEEKALAQIEENLPFAEFKDLTFLMEKLIQKKQKTPINGSIVHNNTQNNVRIVNLQIPQSVLPAEIVLNEQREMIAIGDRSLVPMPSTVVRDMFSKIKEKKAALELLRTADVAVKDLEGKLPEDF